jgi:hypothetical protein
MRPALVAALSVACAGSSQRIVAVGDRTVSGAGFRPYENLWNWAFIDAKGTVKPQGQWSDRLEIGVAGRGGALIDTWRVEVPESDYGLMTFWLSDDPPYIIRLTFPQAGGTIDYEMAG